jgi:serine/threonine protein kinase
LDTLVGTSIGGYTLIKLLGVGGMGSVYLAKDPAIDQQVAVKLIRTEMDAYTDSASAQHALERFRQEARAVAHLDHLHILPLYRYGEEETSQGLRAYMIMQYRPEGSLWDWVRRRADLAAGTIQPTRAELSSGLPQNWPMGLEEVSEYLQQAASALQYAHDRGIVHRDIKPANFLLRIDLHDRTVHLLLSDFGLAKVFTSSSATNTILGTPTYMAPEQFEGMAGPESDQYALAVMVYYLLAGRAPFEGEAMRLMHQHLTAPVPSITALNPAVPPSVNGVLVRALAKQPQQRFPSVTAFAEAFSRAVQQPQSLSSHLSVPGAALPARSGSLSLSNQAAPVSPAPLVLPDPASRRGYPTPSPVPQTGGTYNVQAPYANSPNAYAPPAYAPVQTPVPVPGYQPPYDPRMGGQRVSRRGALGWILGTAAVVAAGAGAGIYFYTRNNGLPGLGNGLPDHALHVLKGHSAAVTSLSWQPSGSQLTSGSLDKTARLWSASDGSAVATINTTSQVRATAWSPDGAILATGEEDRSIQLWKADGSAIKRQGLWGAPVVCLAWRGNNLLFLGTNGSSVHALDIASYKRYGKTSLARITSLAISPDQSLMAVALGSGEVYFADLNNGWTAVATIPSAHGGALSAAWSPDGSLVAVGYTDNYAVVYDAGSKTVRYNLKHVAPVYSVAWSPSTTAPILASGAGDGSVNIWNLSGQGNQTIYRGHSDAVLAVAWSSTMLASASKDQSVILWEPPAA